MVSSCGGFNKASILLMNFVQIGFHWVCIPSLIGLKKILAVDRKEDLLKSEERQSETKLGWAFSGSTSDPRSPTVS